MTQSNRRRRTDRARPNSSQSLPLLEDNDIKQILKEVGEKVRKFNEMLRRKLEEDVVDRAQSNASHGLRLLEDKDIELVLDSVGKKLCKADVGLKQKLKDDINELLTLIIGVREVLCARLTPHEKLDAFCKVQTKVDALKAAMQDCGISLVEEADVSAPGEPGHQLLGPRDIAYDMVDTALHGVSNIHSWAESGRKRALDHKGEQPNHLRTARYVLIVELSTIFARTFDLPLSATRRGPWCLFLKEVLSLSEDQELTKDGAHDIWLTVRRWKKSKFPDHP